MFKVVAMIPIKLDSKRFPNKNLKEFDDGIPLINLIQKTALKIKEIEKTYVFCSDDKIQKYLLKGIDFLPRSKTLDSDSTNATELLDEFVSKVDSEIYVMLHATSPFVTSGTIIRGIKGVSSNEYDSAYPVQKLQKFVWFNGSPLNFSLNPVPRTQDVEPVYCEIANPFIFRKEVFTEYRQRTGKKPLPLEQSWIESVDIDEPEDFEVAQLVYTFLNKDKKL